jgi:hypothetical protein
MCCKDNFLTGPYLGHTQDGSYEFTEIGLNATARPYDRITLGVQIAAQDFGRYYNMKPQIDWAYGRYELPQVASWLDANIAAGRVKYGHGLYNDYRDLDMTRASVFLPQSNYAPAFRDLYLAGNGLQLNLSADAGRVGSFDLSVFVGTNNIDKEEGGIYDSFAGAFRDLPFYGPADVTVEDIRVERVEEVNLTWNTPLDGLRAKGSLMHASHFDSAGTFRLQNDTPAIPPFVPAGLHNAGKSLAWSIEIPDYWQTIASLEYQVGEWTFASEWSHDIMIVHSTVVDPALGNTEQRMSTQFDSGYLSASWRFHPRLEGFACLNATNYQTNGTYNDNNKHRGYVGALRWDVTKHFLVKAEFERNQGGVPAPGGGQPARS